MPYQGSSRIISIITTVQGGIGPTGNSGPIGNTGNYVTGPNGFPGFGITGFTYDSSIDGLTFYIEGSTAVYLTGFRGNTGNSPTLPPPTVFSIGTGISFLGFSGYTLFFKSLTFSAGISAYISGQSIFIRDDLGITGSFDENRLLFVDFSQNTYFLDSSEFAKYKENTYSSITYANFEIAQRTSRDLFGVDNFNYSTGSVQNSSHYGLTMTIDSSFYGITGTETDLKIGTWNPYLKYRANYYDLNGASGPTFASINFSVLGPYTTQVKFTVELGSCCYCDNCENDSINGRKCEDYVLKEYCDSIEGRWSKSTCYQRENGFDCYRRRACCVNGVCLNTSEQKCSQMGGTFCASRECTPNYDCSAQCSPITLGGAETTTLECCCCKDGKPHGPGSYTTELNSCNNAPQANECSQTQGNVISKKCCGAPDGLDCIQEPQFNNCCPGIKGACCRNNTCENDLTPQACMEQNGFFLGENTTCESNSCPTQST